VPLENRQSPPPNHWGGGEVDFREFYSAIGEVARAEGCAGWVAGVVGVHPWQIALYSKEAQEEVWGDDATTMNSSSYATTGKAERVPGGFRLSSPWQKSAQTRQAISRPEMVIVSLQTGRRNAL
jgi:3-hydroxy-9,10-secoandrosta-1,3,5(10)-triene-9,17-dione monooxygenase